MKNGENESRGAREARSQAMVIDAATAPVGRRDVTALVGALAGLVATGCLGDAEGSESIEDVGSTAQAATGTSLRWVDTVLGSVAPAPRIGDLATQNSTNLGGAIVVLAKGCVSAGDGGGGVFYWDSSPATDDGGTIIVPSAGGGCWRRIFDGPVNAMWFGAQGVVPAGAGIPPSGDETAIGRAVAAGIAIGRPVTGAGRTYPVFGDIQLPANTQLQDITFKQFAPGGSDRRRTLKTENGDNIRLVRVKVNRNGDGKNGNDSLQDSGAGIWIDGGTGHHFEDVEVWGDDKGNGFVIHHASNFDVVRLHVHDIRYDVEDPEDDRVQGIWFNDCRDFRLIAPKLHDLGSVSGTTERSRNAIGGCTNFSLIDAQVWNVDQGLDLTGSEGNKNFRILGGSVRDCFSAGYKFANSPRGGVVIGATAERCGLYGFFVAGPSGCEVDGATGKFKPQTGDITFAGCVALDTGTVRWAQSGQQIRPAGFAVEQSTYHRRTSPLGIRFVNCTAIERREPAAPGGADPRMKYGFANEILAWPDSAEVIPPETCADPPPPIPEDPTLPIGRYNECINCVSIGHTASPTWQMHRAFCQVKLTAPQSPLSSGAWVPVDWSEDRDEGAMHASGVDRYIYARQPGLYQINVSLEFEFNISGGRGLRLNKNDVPIPGTLLRRPPLTSGGDETRIGLTWHVLCAAGDKLSVDAFQQSGVGLKLTTNSRMIVTKLHNTGPEA